ncbi:Acetyltransferase (GNAT) family [Musa troglodytarum]|uniref:Acetyltransferase (GNAT) family n=1 Tax=Musa troglodytarum TaxID=320322 RepID=A0A9E7KC03_9LILI|nr:Acetyltransferase (GNAT) family [Musa troglodytarum]
MPCLPMQLCAEPARLGSARRASVTSDAFGVRRLEGWTKRVVGPLGAEAVPSKVPFSEDRVSCIQVGSGWLPPDPSEGQVSICRGKLVVALERKKSLLLFSDVAYGFGDDCLGSTIMTYTQIATEFLINNQAIQPAGRMLLLVPPA